MGGTQTKKPHPPSSPPPSPLLSLPWRTLQWEKRDRDEMKQKLKQFKVSTPDVGKLRILVHGPVGAGKSSFINSIDSIFMERMTCTAIAEKVCQSSTQKYIAHRIKDGSYESFLPFVICDTMGLEKGDSEGAHIDDLIKILEGHIKDGYTFNPVSPHSKEQDEHQNQSHTNGIKDKRRSVSVSDMVHCLVSVIPSDSPLWCTDSREDQQRDEIIKKMVDIRGYASTIGIPQVVVLTKVDQACPEVNKNIQDIYRSRTISEKIGHCSNVLGVPESCIFPVKNYHKEISLDNNIDILLLSALTTILNFANDYVAERKREEEMKD